MSAKLPSSAPSGMFADCISRGMRVPDKCMLCGDFPPHQMSHVIPRLVSKHIGELLGSQRLRCSQNINARPQDTAKFPLLCEGCEARLGKLERHFAIKQFRPYYQGRFPNSYDKAFHELLVSVAYRVLCYISVGAEHQRLTDTMRETMDIWRSYLKSGDDPGTARLFVVRDHELKSLHPSWSEDKKYCMSFGVRASHDSPEVAAYFAYCHMGGFHLFAHLGAVVAGRQQLDDAWTPYSISSGDGVFAEAKKLPQEMLYILTEEDRHFADVMSGMSDGQRNIIRAVQESAAERLAALGLRV
jgi:hypothetical protein